MGFGVKLLVLVGQLNWLLNFSIISGLFLHHLLLLSIYYYFFFLREFQPMASDPNDSSFITRPRHQLVFGVGMDWTLDLLYNHQRLYQLSWLAPTSIYYYLLPSCRYHILSTLVLYTKTTISFKNGKNSIFHIWITRMLKIV